MSLLALLLLTPASAQESLVVETYNVGLAYGFVDYAEERRGPIQEALAASEADLICLQEVWAAEDKAAISEAAAASYPYAFSTPVKQTKAERSPACRIRDLFGKDRFVSCMTGSCGGLDGDALTDCIVNQCGPILEGLKTEKPDCATSLMAQVGKPAPKALWTVIRPIRKAGVYAYDGSDGLVLLSRAPLEDTGELDFSDIATLNRRRALYATVPVDGEDTRFYCTHLSANLDDTAPYPGPFASWAEENRAQTDRLVAHAAGVAGPAVLMGDFNCSFSGGGLQAEAEDSCQAVVDAGYRDPGTEAGVGCTWCAGNPLTGPDSADTLLDHVFVRGLMPGEGAVSRTEPLTLEGGEEVRLSDHYGYRVTLRPEPLVE
jgi:endonuclease/exonuclease/phosphatase family metal-dependent hydrolase